MNRDWTEQRCCCSPPLTLSNVFQDILEFYIMYVICKCTLFNTQLIFCYFQQEKMARNRKNLFNVVEQLQWYVNLHLHTCNDRIYQLL